MTVVAWIFALLAAAIHIVVFAWEVPDRASQRASGSLRASLCPSRASVGIRVGFYNLFLGCGMVVGVIAWMSGNETVGRTLVTYICLFMVLSGIVLFIADRLGFGGERGKSIGGALSQSLPPLVALTAALL
jgi:putative membrane protein